MQKNHSHIYLPLVLCNIILQKGQVFENRYVRFLMNFELWVTSMGETLNTVTKYVVVNVDFPLTLIPQQNFSHKRHGDTFNWEIRWLPENAHGKTRFRHVSPRKRGENLFFNWELKKHIKTEDMRC